MKTIGLLGGMSWESSIEYERTINQAVRERLGGSNSAELLIRSFNFAKLAELQQSGDWDEIGRILANAAKDLENSGADVVLICANTMHLLFDEIQAAISVPVLHVADAAGEAIVSRGTKSVLLLGTKYTMEKPFYADRLRNKFGLEVQVPTEDERNTIHEIIYGELVRGVINPESHKKYLEICERYTSQGVAGIIAGCTEIELLIKPEDFEVPLFATANLHAMAAVNFALADS
jgi:aspartate racemase